MIRKILENKKADIPVMILVIGVIGICSLTLLSFFINGSRVSGYFSGVVKMQELSFEIDKYTFYKNLGLSDEEINSKMNILTDSEGQRYIYVEEIGTTIEPKLGDDWTKKEVVFSAKYIFNN